MNSINQKSTLQSRIKKILGSSQDGEFNNVARLAANVLNVPFVLISLTNGGATSKNSDVAISVSSNAYLPEDFARKHPEVIKASLSESDDLNFYATAPLVSESGDHLGTLYAFDRDSGLWGNVHWEILDVIANIITGQLELKLAAQEVIQSQQDMAYKMSHDIRGAVCNIPVLVKMIRDENEDPEKQKALGNMIVKAAEKGLQSVEHFYTHSRMFAEAGTTDKEMLNLSDLTQKAAVSHRPLADRKGAHINMLIEPNINISGNARNLTKMIDNLLGNAIKYSFADQTIDVILVKSKDYILIEVRDEGVGMSKSDITTVAQHLESLSERPDQPDNTGLGLWMVNEIAREHFGKVNIKSRGKGKGTTFTVMLPNMAEEQKKKPAMRSQQRSRNAYQKKNSKITPKQINTQH